MLATTGELATTLGDDTNDDQEADRLVPFGWLVGGDELGGVAGAACASASRDRVGGGGKDLGRVGLAATCCSSGGDKATTCCFWLRPTKGLLPRSVNTELMLLLFVVVVVVALAVCCFEGDVDANVFEKGRRCLEGARGVEAMIRSHGVSWLNGPTINCGLEVRFGLLLLLLIWLLAANGAIYLSATFPRVRSGDCLQPLMGDKGWRPVW